MFTVVTVFLVLMMLALVFVRNASVVSGNHLDPFRDVGNGGMTVEESFLQFARENPDVDIDALARQHGVDLRGYQTNRVDVYSLLEQAVDVR